MHSSTSPSERGLVGVREGALPAGLRQTAANRPGQAQPVPTRDIPTRPWARIGGFVFLAVTLLMTAWEWNARTNLGLRAGDIDDSPQAWAEARRAADFAPVAIVGDSQSCSTPTRRGLRRSPVSGRSRSAMSARTAEHCSSISRTTRSFMGY